MAKGRILPRVATTYPTDNNDFGMRPLLSPDDFALVLVTPEQAQAGLCYRNFGMGQRRR